MSLKSVQSKLTSFGLTLALVLGMVTPIFFAQESKALTNSDCNPTVGTSGTFTATATGNDCVIVFTGDTTWTIPNGVSSIRFLLVGGGAAGRWDGGGGGGGGGGLSASNLSVTAGNVARIDVGVGGDTSPSNGSPSQLDLNGDSSYEWVAAGGSVGTGWGLSGNGIFAEGGPGGLTLNQAGATPHTGGSGGQGSPSSTAGQAATNSGIGNGFTSDITGSTLYYGGGGGGGIGAHSNNQYNTGTYGGALGGFGGGGAGAKQLSFADKSSNSVVTIGYRIDGTNQTSSYGQYAYCNANVSYPHTTKGWNGLNGYGGGGGGGAAYGDGCAQASNTGDDGERTSGGAGGNGVVIVRFTVSTIATPSTPDLDAASDTGVSSTDNSTSDTTPTFSGTATPGSTIQLQRDGVNTGSTCLTNSSGNWSCTTSTLSHSGGGNAYRAVATFFGQTATSGTLTVVIRTSGPGAMSVSRSGGSTATLYFGETATINFSAGTTVTGFTLEDITVTGGSLSNFTTISGRDFSATFTPSTSSSGTASVSVGANTFYDLAGYSNTAGTAISIQYSTYSACTATPDTSSATGYTIYKFTTVGTCNWTIPAGVLSVRALIVGGGGGGGAWVGGGGGGGGFREIDSVDLTNLTKITVTVGAGGNGATYSITPDNNNSGSSGESSSFASYQAAGGGKGAGHPPSANFTTGGAMEFVQPRSGGSGGGGTGSQTSNATTQLWTNGATGNSPSTTPVQGYSGGNGYVPTSSGNIWTAGGGGGAGGAGTSGTSSAGGNGGVGALSNITGADVYYAGGGAGSYNGNNSLSGTGGTGGGGTFKNSSAESNGTDNLGGGGAGSGGTQGGKGGSGVVIIRYAGNNTVAFNNNGGSGTMASQTIVTGAATPLTSNTFIKAGYIFAGWNTNANGTSGINYSDGQSVTISTGMTLYAKWAGSSNTVTFDSNGGTSIANGSFITGSTLSKPNSPTKSKKIFGGWSTSETSNQGDVANLVRSWPYTPSNTSSFILYAIWLDDNALNLAGTQRTSARVLGTSGSPVTVVPSDRSFTWEAWIYPTGFAGTGATKWASILDNGDDGNNYGRVWFQVMDSGSGPYLSAGYLAQGSSQIGFSAATAANRISLNAWQHVAVVYERPSSAEGTCSSSAGTLRIQIFINGVSMQNQTGTGFSGCVNSLGLIIGDNYDDADQQFKGKIDQVKIWDGVLTQSEVVESMKNYSVGTVDNTLRAHYSFNELNGTPALNDKIYNLASDSNSYDLQLYGASTTDVINNISRFQNLYDIAFDGNTNTSGSVATQTGVLPYESITISSGSTLAKTGYTFGAWNALANGTGSSFNVNDSYLSLYGNTTLYAVWTGNSVTITYNYNGATSNATTASASATVGGSAITLPSPSKTGYTFAGWFVDSGFSIRAGGAGGSYTPSGSSSSVNLYARWVNISTTNMLINVDAANPASYSGSGSTWTDLSGNGNHLTLCSGSVTLGGTSRTVTAPTFDSANSGVFNFDSSYDCITKSSLSLTASQTNFSYFTWIKPSSIGAIQSIAMSNRSWTYTSPIWRLDLAADGKLFFLDYNGTTGFNGYSSGTLTANQWAYVGIVRNGTSATFYINGVSSGSITTSTSVTYASDRTFTVGIDYRDGINPFQGSLGAIHYYSAAIASDTILSNYYESSRVAIAPVNTSGPTISGTPINGQTLTASTGSWSPVPNSFAYQWKSSSDGSTYTDIAGATNSTYVLTSAENRKYVKVAIVATNDVGNSTSASSAAVFSEFSLTVTYDSQGGTDVTSGTVNTGSALTAPTAPTKSGFYFLGWSTTANGATVSFPYTHGQTSNFTLYAIWTTGVYSNNLRINLDATNRDSLASDAATVWKSIAPGQSVSSIDKSVSVISASSSSPGHMSFGANPYVNFGHTTAAEITGAITVEAWIKLDSSYVASTAAYVIANHYYSATDGSRTASTADWYFQIKDGRIGIFTTNSSNAEFWTYSSVGIDSTFAGQWISVGFTESASGTVQFYLNGRTLGAPITGVNPQRGSTTAKLMLGRGLASLIVGMSKFRMYAEALTPDQIRSNYNLDASNYSRLQARTISIDAGSYTSTYLFTASSPTITSTASAGSGTKSYSSSTSSVCTINSSTGVVAFVSAGTCTITASIGVDSTYDVATSSSISFTITYPALAITYVNGGGTGSGPALPISVSYGSTFTIPANTFTRPGYQFSGWKDGANNSFAVGATYPSSGSVTSDVTLTAQWTNCASGVVQSGLLIHLDAGSPCSTNGSTSSWFDISGNSNHATLYGTPTYSTGTGSYYTFGTTAKYGAFPAGLADFTGGFSISFFAKFGSTPALYERIIDFGNTSSISNNIILSISDATNGILTLNTYSGATSLGACSSDSGYIGKGSWAFYSFTVNSSTKECKIYKNGNLMKTVASAFTAMPNNISRANNYLGKLYWTSGSPPAFSGSIGDFALYNSTLSASDVKTNFLAQIDTSFTVTYDGNGNDSGAVPTDTNSPYLTGDQYRVIGTANGISKTGYTFNWWCSVQPSVGQSCTSAGGTRYMVGNMPVMGSSNVTLYAIWNKNISITAANQSKTYTGSAVVVSNTVSLTSGTLNGSEALNTTFGSFTYTGINGTSYNASTTAPTAVGTYSIMPSLAKISNGDLAETNYGVTYVAGTLTISYAGCGINPTTSGGYTIYRFVNTGNCSFTIPSGVSIADILVVGGGGAGGSRGGGGGGAGGYRYFAGQSVTGGTLVSIGVGAGGTGTAPYGVAGAGGDSNFDTLISLGGGGGGIATSGDSIRIGQSGGSSGGSAGGVTGVTKVASGIAGQGSNGGNGSTAGGYPGGGGGGSGGVGADANAAGTQAGKGGRGTPNSITGTPVCYATGGGGGINGYTAGAGGDCQDTSPIISGVSPNGGTGNTSSTAQPAAASANTGAGGGGAGWGGTDVKGGNGGSGIVVFRYISTVTVTPTTSASSMIFGNSSGFPTAGYSTSPSVTLTTEPTCNFYASSDISFSTPITFSSTTPVGNYVVKCTGGAYSTTGANIEYGSNASFSVSLNSQAALILTSTSGTYGSTVSLTSSGGSGSGAVTYAVTSAGTAGCSISSTTLSATSAGTCTVTVTKAADSNYSEITSVATVVTIDKAAQTITFAKPSDRKVSSGTFSVTASSSSSLTVTITSTTTSVCSISAGTVTLVTVGTCTLRASQLGNAGYSAATDINQSFEVSAIVVTFNSNFGTPSTSTQNLTSPGSSTLNSFSGLSFSRSGYTFSSWNTANNGGGTSYTDGQGVTFTSDISLYAQWSPNALTISYDSQGGSSVTSGTVNTGASISAAPTAPTKAGYTLTGWATTNNGSVVTFPYAHGQTANFTLYAIWSANSNAIVFNNNNGSGTMANQTINSGTATALSTNTFTRTGYTFAGWNTNADGTSGTSYSDGQSVTITAGMTLYAKWTGNTNTVTYDSKGGSSVANGSFITGGLVAAAPTAPTKAGYSLTGWSATDGGSAVTFPYSPGTTAGITLYALWSAISCSPTSATTGGYTIYTFATAGTCFWTVPNGVTSVEVLVVGAGGGGGYAYDNAGGGGGAGGQVKTGTATLSATETITVGTGGAAGTTGSRRGGSGDNSVAGGVTALGGTGGCGARSSCSNSAQATANAAANGGAGGAGGASGKGGGGSNISGSLTSTTAGGTGTTSSYSGTSATYGVGGAGGTARGLSSSTNITGPAGSANTGNGGGGASAKSASGDVNGGAGGSGLVIIRVASALTITYDSQSGSAVSDGSTITGGTISAAPTEPTRSNYTFLGWFTATTGGSAIAFPYAHGQTASFTLYAHWSLNTYAITFNANNGSGTMGNQTFTHGVATGLNANLFTRANYVFYRWATAADGSGTTYSNLAQVTLTSGTTLYAQWTANTYVVTYNYDSATGGASTNTSSFTTGGSAITLPTPTKTGYNFGGWYSDAALTTSIGNAGASYSPTGTTLTLNAYAKWTAINYTFTYDANNADSGTVPTETSKQIAQTATVKANTGSLVRAGYTFSGWNTTSDGTGTSYLSGAIFTVGSSNVTLYAKWNANTYTITYNPNGGSGNAQRSSSNVTSDSYTTGGSPVTLPGVGSLQRSGYTFAGWNTSANGTGTDYLAAASYTTVSNVTFYAKWSPVTYSITYNGNTSDGGSAPTTGSYTTGQASPYSVLSNSFTKTSHVFGGWNTAANGSGTSYSPGATFTTLADVTLYATWIAQYTLHYAVNGGTVSSGSLPADQLYNSGTVVGPVFSNMSRTGYTFDGWTNGATTIAPGGNFTILADSVLTAKWTAINYTISYNSDGGTEAPTQITKQIGQSHTVGGGVTKPGYNFAGWSNGTSVVGPGANIVTGASDVTYTAQWTPKVYQVSYDWNGGRGTAVNDVAYTFGNPAITLPTVGDRVKDGYTFAGWSESSNGSILGSSYTPSQSRTLYAQWALGNFTITYDAGRGTVANSTVQVQNGSSTTLPLPTRANFVFDGWHTANTGGNSVGAHGASFTPSASQTVYARWIQSSIYGISNSLSRIGSVTTSNNIGNTFTGANANSSVSVSVPANAFEAGTTINFDLVGDSSRATGLISGVDYLVSIAVSWLTGNETVPDTAAGKPVSVTISNPSIKAGAAAYAIVNNVSTLLGTATQDGTITVSITSDPEIVVAATKPDAPTSVTASSNGNQQSVISWTAPSSNGGSAITGYTVTSNTGATCTSSTTSCTISSLANGTAYTFTVTATNTVGTSVASSAASATTASVYAVTFDSKGGSTVTNGSYLTAGTVAEPTAPTKNGYAFAGWAATDGGNVEVFPYSPGTTSNITMFARWDALDHVVTFDSTSGSAVADGVYASGGTVAEPTAPTRSGYTFGGWSATNGGSRITFPYAPGVFTDITLYAKWTAVSSGGSSSSSSSNSNSSSSANNSGGSSSGGASSNNNIAVLPPVTVVGSLETKIPSIKIVQPGSDSDQTAPAVKIDAASDKFIADVKIVDGELLLTPEIGFSGKKTVTVTINQDGIDKVILVPIVVLPETVSKPIVTPISTSKTVIKWTESPNATGYTVYVNGKKSCTTTGISCALKNILGPKADVTIVSNGGDKTVSQRMQADFAQTKPIQVTRIVSATNTKSTFTKTDISALNKLVNLVKSQGFGTVVISQIATTSKNQKLADARIDAIKKYISDKVGAKNVDFEITPPSSKTIFNNLFVKG